MIDTKLLKKLIEENPEHYVFMGGKNRPEEWDGLIELWRGFTEEWDPAGLAIDADTVYRIKMEYMVQPELPSPKCRDCGAETKVCIASLCFYVECTANKDHTTGCMKSTKMKAIEAYPARED